VLRASFEEHQAVVAASIEIVLPVLEEVVALTVDRLAAGHQVLAFGNGGSAAQAQHFTAEITGRFAVDRAAWPAVALVSDGVLVSAVANDYGFEHVFERQVQALARAGDVAVAISTSGTSPNVVRGAAAARDRGCAVVALTGAGGGDLAPLATHLVAVASTDVPRIQEVHAICLHAWAQAVEAALVAAGNTGAER
jgi:D-sedoheptulose 7-phosphate isomerase